jgi:hypothetical protein
MGNSHISNEALPPEQQVVNEYAGADAQLRALIGYLDDSLRSMRERRAYVAPAGRWYLQPYGDKRAKQRAAAGRLVIEKNFYATMAPASVEQLDEEAGWKAIARPNINSETAWAFKTPEDARTAQLGQRHDSSFKEKDLVGMRRKGDFKKLEIKVIGEGLFELSEEAFDYLKGHTRDRSIWFEQSVQVLLRKREFAEMLLDRPGKQHEPLKQMLEADFEFEPSPHVPLPEDRWIELTKPEIMGTEQQREFVEKALNGKDFTVVWGPAGSGKTTAICEFIRQAVRANKKVLMVGSTHVAVDNVLEKFARTKKTPTRDDEVGVVAVRVGRPAKVSDHVRPLLIENFLRTHRERLQGHLKPLADSTQPEAQAARRMLESVDGTTDEYGHPEARGGILHAILMGANLVCGTTIGILQHPAVRQARETGTYPEFDYLILDEASKTTLDEFLVPAMCAKRWIIVGDPYQLAPFCEEAELGATMLAAMMGRPVASMEENVSQPVPNAREPKLRKVLQAAIKASLEERAVRFQDDSHARRMVQERNAAVGALTAYVVHDAEGNTVSLEQATEQAMAIALPSVLEALIGQAEGLPSARSIVRPLREGLASRMVKLKYQHRMPRHLADFAKEHVYKGRMLHTPDNAKEKSRLHSNDMSWEGRLVVLTAADPAEQTPAHQDRERESARQLVLAVKELLDFAAWAKANPKPPGEDPWRAYLISTYKNQNQLCQRLVEYLYEAHGDLFDGVDVEANTVDSCQGHEADLVILSLVRDRQTPFMRSLNRMNVAFTRARSRMVILEDIPSRTEEAEASGQACTMLDALHDYPVTRIEAKHLDVARSIVDEAFPR